MKKKKILITGSSGFIALNFLKACENKNFEITCIDKVKSKIKFSKKIIFFKIDISKKNEFSVLKKKRFDFILHCAAFSKPSKAEKFPKSAYETNIIGTKNLLDFVHSFSKNAKVFFFSGGALYDSKPKYLPIDEKHPIKPYQNTYCFTKRSGENICSDYIKYNKMRIIIFRLFNTYGPYQDSEFLIPSWIKKCKKKGKYLEILNGSIIRDFNYVENLIELIFILMKKKNIIGGPFNVGSGRPAKLINLANYIANYFDKKVRDLNSKNTFGSKKQVSSIKKIKKVSGWRPKIGIEEGLIRTIKFYN